MKSKLKQKKSQSQITQIITLLCGFLYALKEA